MNKSHFAKQITLTKIIEVNQRSFNEGLALNV
jgi:hypothetical protein